ncbi:anticodon binding domain of tRNAs-domain-containing protein [Podospora aff. communis PSN243]|uniref:non-specific serine/threonine protein kinase n=1 Tax=Podospora aff. communis PSN243 TaxID=3040156 RepID=A0AAV9H005_9PEZI|nr:anticodon binding domain of tRNAs-domain-containing protein [Podospora aff. communis PSN243]
MAGRKKPSQAAKKEDGSFPGLKAPGKPENKTPYEELQVDEVTALQAIYGDDFIEHKTKTSAWKKSEPAFDIQIKASSDDDFAVTLGVVLVATYPKSPPLLTVKPEDGLQESVQFKIQKFVETQPKIFALDEQAMIDRIVEGIRDILEEAAQKKAQGLTLPSLEEERAAHAAQLAKLAQDEKEQQERQKLEETKEEERVLGDMLQEELKRQRAKVKESRKKHRSSRLSPERSVEHLAEISETLSLDQPCKLTDGSGNALYFRTVVGRDLLCQGPITTVYQVQPVLSAGKIHALIALKQVEVKFHGKDPAQFKKQIASLDSQLESLKSIQHPRVLQLLDFRIDRGIYETDSDSPTPRTVSILTMLSDRGSLNEHLGTSDTIGLEKVRSWTPDLLKALDFLHNHDIIHKDLHSGNILLCREPAGDIVPKIADAGYQRELHTLCAKVSSVTSARSAKSAYWFPPEIAGVSKPQYTQRTDVWDFGIVFLQMVFGRDVLQKYHSPASLMESLSLSGTLEELVSRFFKTDPKKRPRAFELSSSEFFATNDAILDESDTVIPGSPHIHPRRSRHDSMNRTAAPTSRYQEDYMEEAQLGKGGFGEVVRARNKIDGHLYAIKKITQRSKETLSETLKEVQLLSQMNHPAVVRYYHTWLETVPGFSDENYSSDEEATTEGSRGTLSAGINIDFADSMSRGLDFMPSSAKPLGESSEDEDEDEESAVEWSESESDDGSTSVGDGANGKSLLSPPVQRYRRGSSRRQFRTMMYISMEHCEKRTLRDLIAGGLYKDTQEVWRLFRQILEGLVHIHGLNIVHRDLKPENIFISKGSDGIANVKIGDFGLATSGRSIVGKGGPNQDAGDLTRSIGTTAYVAPEVRTGGSGSYTAKVDMFSLGVIFFEMSSPPMVGMERALALEGIRKWPPIFPAGFKPTDKNQQDVIVSLLTHNSEERPSSAELLQSDKLPLQKESETIGREIRRDIASLADPKSPYFKEMISALFARQLEQAKIYAWDMSSSGAGPTSAELMRRHIVKDTLIQIFRRHGAVEMETSYLYPRSSHHGQNAVQLLDRNGTVLQLPFDLVTGYARALARATSGPVVEHSFSFGSIFRDREDGGQPDMYGEVDFNIVTADALDLALKEAEVIKVLDEIVTSFPTTSSTPTCFHLGHSDLLNLIFEFCGVKAGARRAAADVLSKLNIRNFTWQKVRSELRSPEVGLSTTSIDELQKFDFRDTPSKAISKLKTLLEGTEFYQRATPIFAHLREVYEYSKRFGVTNKVYICPLSSINEAFFRGGILFACLYDKKVRDVFAAGGRYDSLIKDYRPKIGNRFEERHAVGFSMNWEKQLAKPVPKATGKAFLKKAAEEEGQGIFSAKRCDVLVASFDPSILRSSGIELVQTLWAHGISAALARDSRSPEDLLSKYRDESHSWIVIIKQDNVLKIKPLGRKDAPDADIAAKELLSWLKSEIRERDSRSIMKYRSAAGNLPPSESTNTVDTGQDLDVHILVAQMKSKKFNRRVVVEQAQASAQSFLNGTILAIETSDAVVDLIDRARLSDPESWRRVEHTVGTAEKKYVREIHELLKDWRSEWESKKGSRHAYVYNFRTTKCIYYDLGG